MATAKKGPLVDDIKGSVGGTTFQGGSRDQFIRARVKNIDGQSSWQRQSRNLMALASTTWATLAAADRDAWVDLCGGWRRGYVQYLRSWLGQVGAEDLEAPPVPQFTERPGAIQPQVAVDEGDLTLTGMTRNLLASEEMILRTYKQIPPSWNKIRRATQGYTSVKYGAGLGITPNRVQDMTPTPYAYAWRAQDTTTSTTWTLEIWIKPDVTQAIDPACLWAKSSNTSVFYWKIGDFIRFYVSGAYKNLGAALPGGRWYYVALRADGVAGTVDLWINGQLYGGPVASAPGAWTGTQTLGARWDDQKYRVIGRFGPVRLSRILRSQEEIEDVWNSGLGRPFEVDISTECLLVCDEVVGNMLIDRAPNYRHWYRENLGNAWGPFCRVLYPSGEKYMSTGKVNIQTGIKDLTRLAGQPVMTAHDF